MRIPVGTFLMGSPKDENGRRGDEGPQHRVTVRSFWIGRYTVTNEQFACYLEANPPFGFAPPMLPSYCSRTRRSRGPSTLAGLEQLREELVSGGSPLWRIPPATWSNCSSFTSAA